METSSAVFRGGDERHRQHHPAGYASAEPFREAVDPGYWPRAIGLRLLIASCYAILVPWGLLPMSNLWFAISGGVLFGYSLAMCLLYVRFRLLKSYQIVSPYIDTVVV